MAMSIFSNTITMMMLQTPQRTQPIFSMNLWSILMTTDFTSDKPKIAQNNVLKLSSILEKLRNQNVKTLHSVRPSAVHHRDINCNNLITTHFRDTHVVNALLYLTPRQYEYKLNIPTMKATKTVVKITMNLKISFTVLPSEICNGPKLSLAGRMYAMREKLSTTATAQRPSEMSCGSEGDQSTRAVIKQRQQAFYSPTRLVRKAQTQFSSLASYQAGNTGSRLAGSCGPSLNNVYQCNTVQNMHARMPLIWQ